PGGVQGPLDRADLEGPLPQPAGHLRGIVVTDDLEQLGAVLGRGQSSGHLLGVFEARLLVLEGSDEGEDRSALLIRMHSSCRERSSVPEPLDTELDGLADVPGTQEVAVQGMDGPGRRESGRRGPYAECEYLRTVDAAIGFVRAGADAEFRLARRSGDLGSAQVEQLPRPCAVRLRLGGCVIGHAFSPSDDSAYG